MQGTASPSGGGEQHEQAVVSALDLICSSSEQTYSQFLASFTQLSPDQAPLPGAGEQHEESVVSALDLTCSSSEQTYSQFLTSSTQLNPETQRSQQPKDTCRDDWQGGGGGDRETNRRGQQDPSDLRKLSYSMDEAALRVKDKEGDLQGYCLVPGEMEEDECLSAHASLIVRSTQLEMSSAVKPKHSTSLRSGERGTQSTGESSEVHTMHFTGSALGEHTTHPASSDMEMHTVTSFEQVDREEVQPFHLDKDFDYDHVKLTHKYPTHSRNPKAS